MGVLDVIRSIARPRRPPTAELERRIAEVEEHVEEVDQRLDEAEARMTRLEARRENRRRRLGDPGPPS